MTIQEIQKFPTKYMGDPNKHDYTPEYEYLIAPCHESLLRSFQIVQKVKELCEAGTPVLVILELIELMENS